MMATVTLCRTYKLAYPIMKMIDNSTKIALTSTQFEALLPVLTALDEKLKASFRVELAIVKSDTGMVYLDAQKKERGGFKRRRKALLD
jgi:hypothetical protein